MRWRARSRLGGALALCAFARALDNGAAVRPLLGYTPWNGFGMHFNASLMRRTAHAMASNGLLAAGYAYLTIGGSTYPHAAIAPWNRSSALPNVMVRNGTGHVQIDPARFPGAGSNGTCLDDAALLACLRGPGATPEGCGCANGNDGMRRLVADLKALGFRWGSYSNMAGCQVEACDTPALNASRYGAFIEQDAALYLGEWDSDYLMVDSVGVTPPPGTDRWSWERFIISSWAARVNASASASRSPSPSPSPSPTSTVSSTRTRTSTSTSGAARPPVVLHSCHAQCGGAFAGPVLQVAPCDANEPGQRWLVPDGSGKTTRSVSFTGGPAGGDARAATTAPSYGGYLTDERTGLCAGCTNGPCANDAAQGKSNGLGMQACAPAGMGSSNQAFALHPDGGLRTATNSCLAVVSQPQDTHAHAPGTRQSTGAAGSASSGTVPVALLGGAKCANVSGSPAQRWRRVPTAGGSGPAYAQLVSERAPDAGAGAAALCLQASVPVSYPMDPWCLATANMWRSSTDTLQTWGRIVMQLESMVGMGRVSGPGAWAFPDALELGVPGGGVLTWEESKSHFALWCVTSAPLMLSNDVRAGYMQPRLLSLVTNKAAIAVNQAWAGSQAKDSHFGAAGDRVWTAPVGRELWAKPLPGRSAAAVLFNRNGTTVQCDTTHPIEAPCDDEAPSASTGAQNLTLHFSTLATWLLDGPLAGTLSCNVTDVFGDGDGAGEATARGRHAGSYTVLVPAHGSAFLTLSACTLAQAP